MTRKLKVEVAGDVRVHIRRVEVTHHIKAWRKYKNLTVVQLGELIKSSPSLISSLELGKTSYTQKTLEAIAGALEIQPWQLLASPPGEKGWAKACVDDAASRVPEAAHPLLKELLGNVCNAAFDAVVDTVKNMHDAGQTDGDATR